MGIRFRCHQCGHELHVKDFQGGKRSKCPECETKFRIPAQSAEYSIPLDTARPLDTAHGDDSTTTHSAPAAHASAIQSAAPVGVAMGTMAKPAPLKPSSRATKLENDPEEGAQPSSAHEVSTASTPATTGQPQAILEAPGATWYVRPPAGGQYGPAPANIFCEWLTENRVTRDALVWRDGWPQWLVAGEVFTDYFGPVLPPTSQQTASALAPTSSLVTSGGPQAIATTEQIAAPEFVAPTSLSDRALAARKRQRKKNYLIMIGILAAISVGLVIALVAVLMQNS